MPISPAVQNLTSPITVSLHEPNKSAMGHVRQFSPSTEMMIMMMMMLMMLMMMMLMMLLMMMMMMMMMNKLL